MVLDCVVGDGHEQVGLSQAGVAIDEQRVVGDARLLGHGERRAARELVGLAHDKGVERALGEQRLVAAYGRSSAYHRLVGGRCRIGCGAGKVRGVHELVHPVWLLGLGLWSLHDRKARSCGSLLHRRRRNGGGLLLGMRFGRGAASRPDAHVQVGAGEHLELLFHLFQVVLLHPRLHLRALRGEDELVAEDADGRDEVEENPLGVIFADSAQKQR